MNSSPSWFWKLHIARVLRGDKATRAAKEQEAREEATKQVRPDHYGGPANPFEPIKIIDHYGMNFSLGNAIKYILRAGKKDPTKTIEDLEKARTYLDFEIARLRREDK